MRSRIRRLAPALAGLAGVLVAFNPSAGADSAQPVWKCRASVGFLERPSQDASSEPARLELGAANGATPSVANVFGDRPQCTDQDALLPALPPGAESTSALVLQAPFAYTRIAPDLGAARDQTVGVLPAAAEQIDTERNRTRAGVAEVTLQGEPGSIRVVGAVAEVAASCAGPNTPAFDSSSRVAEVQINGEPVIPPDQDLFAQLEQINEVTGALIRIYFNRDVPAADPSVSRTRRAVEIQVFPSSDAASQGEPPQLRLVVGEARAVRDGDVCAPPGTTPTTPSDVITGGDAVPKDELPAALRRSPCFAQRFGGQFAIVGTNRSDRITGTNRSDAIFPLRGNDRVDGGRGNDCVDDVVLGGGRDRIDGGAGADLLLSGAKRDIVNGGSGRDTIRGGTNHDKLVGGSGSDRIFGDSGNDKLSGGLGNDRLFGGTGRDYFLGGNGSDTVSGGAGNDIINNSTAGGRDTAICGAGRDILRTNRRVRFRRDCEVVFVIR